jgi:hypothetical protein
LVLVVSYCVALGAVFLAADRARRDAGPGTGGSVTTDARRVGGFPPLDMGFVTILGISNAAFLGSSAVPRTGLSG